MKKSCKKLQKLMAVKGPYSLRDDLAAQKHIADCDECFACLEAHATINERLSDTADIDAPDAVVDKLLATVAALSDVADSAAGITKKEATGFKLVSMLQQMFRWVIGTGGRCLRGFFSMLFPYKRAIAFGFVFVMIGGVMFSTVTTKMLGRVDDAKQVRMQADKKMMETRSEMEALKSNRERVKSAMVSRGRVEKKNEMAVGGKRLKQKAKLDFAAKDSLAEYDSEEEARYLVAEDVETVGDINEIMEEDVAVLHDDMDDTPIVSADEDRFSETYPAIAKTPEIELNVVADESVDELIVPNNELSRRDGTEHASVPPGLYNERKPAPKPVRKNKIGFGKKGAYGLLDKKSDKSVPAEQSVDQQDASGKMILDAFFSQRASIENLQFKKAAGYWGNTYLPGDPSYRWLDSQISQWDRSEIASYMARPLGLDGNARRITQPFDAPVTSALGIFLHADRRGIQGKTRMLVQVGIKGTQRFSGSRPGMNVGIVLDLRGDISDETLDCFKALLTAFGKAKDLGDRFSLTIAGRPGGVVIKPGDFKYGHLSVAMKHLFGEETIQEETLGVIDAMRRASALVSSGDDPTAPLGSSEVIIVTSQSLAGFSGTMAALAHKSAVAGGPVSVIGIGQKVNPAELNQIIYSGQGNRRLFNQPSEADRVVEQELTAVSKVIARAVRLRIRLAAGVQLINVFDSHRLDDTVAQKVRDAEKSIDQRMSKNLGIQADRGDDEDGIQIVIPAFYAGDSHVVLLDVVVTGPGAVADVTVRYKDLVKLKNGVARSNLTLDRSTELPGPLERNVLKNFLARKLSKTLVSAGKSLLGGNDDTALGLLQAHHDLLTAIRANQPGFQRDHDISDDIAMLEDYLAVLNKGLSGIQKQRAHIADSLKFAGKLKVLPRLSE